MLPKRIFRYFLLAVGCVCTFCVNSYDMFCKRIWSPADRPVGPLVRKDQRVSPTIRDPQLHRSFFSRGHCQKSHLHCILPFDWQGILSESKLVISEAENIWLSIFLRTELRWDYSAPLGGMFQGVGLCVGGRCGVVGSCRCHPIWIHPGAGIGHSYHPAVTHVYKPKQGA